MEAQGTNRNQKVIATVAILAAMTLIVFGASAFSGAKSSEAPLASTSEQTTVTTEKNATQTATEQTQTLATTETSSPTTTPSPAPAATTKYKNGTYTASGSYSTPESTESISITVTIENDIVTATSAQNTAKDRESKEWQGDFISGYKSQVVGKAIASLSLGKVSGSSLTPTGFNNAIAKIRTQAQS